MSIIIFLLILIALILVHEFGHFIVAKWSGMRVDEFGLGFPPRLWGKQYGETLYSINAIPFGGFVKIYGEDPTEESMEGDDSQRSFTNGSKWAQAATLVAGVAMNVVFAWFLFTIGFMVGMPSTMTDASTADIENKQLVIAHIAEDSPAAHAGLTIGDRVTQLSVGDAVLENPTPDSLDSFVREHSTEDIAMTISRDGSQERVQLTPQTGVLESEPDRPAIGIAMQEVGTVRYLPHTALWEATKLTGTVLVAITVALGGLIAGAVTFTADLSQVAGPVGIVGLVGDASSLGVIYLLTFTAFISLNLAIINLIPFPALDGGRLLFLAIEAVKGSPIRPAVANTANMIGFALLILLMILVTYNDIARMVGS